MTLFLSCVLALAPSNIWAFTIPHTLCQAFYIYHLTLMPANLWNSIVIPVWLRRTLKYREVRWLVHDHKAGKWKSHNVNVGYVLLSIAYQLMSGRNAHEMWQMHRCRLTWLWVLYELWRKSGFLDFSCNHSLIACHLPTFCHRCSENIDESLLVWAKLWEP